MMKFVVINLRHLINAGMQLDPQIGPMQCSENFLRLTKRVPKQNRGSSFLDGLAAKFNQLRNNLSGGRKHEPGKTEGSFHNQRVCRSPGNRFGRASGPELEVTGIQK